MANNNTTSGGVGISGLLLVLFIGLKLGHVIDWSWWWVLAPAWGSTVLVLVVILIFIGIKAWAASIKARRRKESQGKLS